MIIFLQIDFLGKTGKRKYNNKSLCHILITGGDPAGIGPEIIEKSLKDFLNNTTNLTLAHQKQIVLIYFANSDSLHKDNIQTLCLQKGLDFLYLSPRQLYKNIDSIYKKKRVLVYCKVYTTLKKKVEIGKPSDYSGSLAFQALQKACDFALQYGCRSMLTAPLAKEWVIRSGQFDFRGHTDYLGQRFSCQVLMLMHGRNFSVIPLTVHIPLKEVPHALKLITEDINFSDLLLKVQNITDYKKSFWAICALNPHGGESGLIGSEEKFLTEWCQKLQNKGLLIEGPISADSLFMKNNRDKYRLILSCYHDQGLIPFKAIEGSSGINCTIGLPFLRTSPDHGTAFDIAGRNKADSESMYRALKLAYQGFIESSE